MKFILSIDGGGARIVIAARFLCHLENYLKQKYNNNIYNTFDMFAGTSSGSMIVTPIAYTGIDADEILNNILTYSNVKSIFTKFTGLDGELGIFGNLGSICGFYPRYNSQKKRHLIEKYSRTYDMNYICMNDTKKDCLITGYNINKSEPIFFKSYHSKLDPNKEQDKHSGNNIDIETIVDISTSAPGYFSSIKFFHNDTYNYGLDGGLFAINPTDCAYADALRLYNSTEDIRILSIGLGQHIFESDNVEDSVNWGPLQWLFKGSIINRLTYASIPTVDYRMSSFTKALGHKYLRIDPVLPSGIDFELRDIENYDKMLIIGDNLWDKYKDQIELFFE